MNRVVIEKDSYHDSVFLMLINKEVKQIPGVSDAVVAMATAMNLDLLAGMGLKGPELDGAAPNDLIIAVVGESEASLSGAIESARTLLSQKKRQGSAGGGYRPAGLDAAVQMVEGANLAIISLPGAYAAREAARALSHNLHVMLFSDNVPIEEEIRLKSMAAERGLLMMGPDCGSAIINGKPICFANVVRRGSIGIVAASGTGLQEVSCSIDKLGAGVSQAIGTGGRDLADPRVGGKMMLMGIEALANDPETTVIAVVSKPPAEETAAKVIEALRRAGKPSVVDFLGARAQPSPAGILFAFNLEEAAGMAVALASGRSYTPHRFTIPEAEVERLVRGETSRMARGQKYLRGLFTGGTLADEALFLLDAGLGEIHSNNQTRKELRLSDPRVSAKHTIVDLGDDLFTVGRPHPMIDPSIREERIDAEGEDREVALILLDLVLGYGSHADPAGAIAGSLKRAKAKAAARGGYLSVVASITGTGGDFQKMPHQRRTLEEAGCVVMPSNYQAAMLALKLLEGR